MSGPSSRRVWPARFGLAALIAGLMGFATTPAMACKCAWEGTFEHVSTGKSVVVVQVDEHVWTSDRKSIPAVKATVVEVWTGSAPTSLRVLGDTGSDCRINAGALKTGHRYLLVLGGTDGPSRSVSSCGETVVPIEDGVAVGKLTAAGRLRSAKQDDRFHRSRDDYADQRLSLEVLRTVVVGPKPAPPTLAP